MNKTRNKCILFALILVLVGMFAGQAWGLGSSVGRFTSDATPALLVAGELTLLGTKHRGQAEAVQGAKALITTTALTQVLKYITHEKRPTSSAHNSFPSGHTSAAFALATVIADYHPKDKWIAYGTATAIGWSRIDIRAHHWQDVVAGAALGYFTAKRYTNQHLTITPSGAEINWKF